MAYLLVRQGFLAAGNAIADVSSSPSRRFYLFILETTFYELSRTLNPAHQHSPPSFYCLLLEEISRKVIRTPMSVSIHSF